MRSSELVLVRNASIEPNKFSIWSWLRTLTKWPFQYLPRKQDASHWRWLLNTSSYWERSFGIVHARYASKACVSPFVVLKPCRIGSCISERGNLESRAMPEIFYAVIRYNFKSRWSQIQNPEFDRQVSVQSQPSSFSVYSRFPLYASLLLHFEPYEQSDRGIDTRSNKSGPRSFPYRIVYAVLAICFGAFLSYYVFCITDRYIHTYILVPYLALCFTSLAYGICGVVNVLESETVKKSDRTKKKKRIKEYREGPEAQENFEKTMVALFRSPKVNSKNPEKGKD